MIRAILTVLALVVWLAAMNVLDPAGAGHWRLIGLGQVWPLLVAWIVIWVLGDPVGLLLEIPEFVIMVALILALLVVFAPAQLGLS